MRILYGVQGTGQGHISRARAMASALRKRGVKVDWLFSGRSRRALRDMEPFADFAHRRGLTFVTGAGRVRHRKTIMQNNAATFLRDVYGLKLGAYDLVITDFEPVTAWAARLRGVPSIGIGHQYAVNQVSPVSNSIGLGAAIMRHFAPAQREIGLHWYPYSDSILPPILDLPALPNTQGNEVLVYLPFESQEEVTRLLRQFPGQRFIQYAPGLDATRQGNIVRQPTNVAGFKQHLHECRGVICNSGFELVSECLQLHKPVLTKPLRGQIEQESNALALQLLDYATVTTELTETCLERWLSRPPAPPLLRYPNVAAELACWLDAGCSESNADIAQRLWQQVQRQTLLRPQLSSTPISLLA